MCGSPPHVPLGTPDLCPPLLAGVVMPLVRAVNLLELVPGAKHDAFDVFGALLAILTRRHKGRPASPPYRVPAIANAAFSIIS